MANRCKVCGLSEAFPNSNFVDNECRYCRTYVAKKYNYDDEAISKFFKDQVKAVSSVDIIVGLSGGKDSSYTLKYLAGDLGLRCKAVLLDNGYISERALVNCKLICDELSVELVVVRPPASQMKGYYREKLMAPDSVGAQKQRSSDICEGCISMVNATLVRYAKFYGCNVVAGGYIEGQVPSGDFKYIIDSDENIWMASPLLALGCSEEQIIEYLRNLGWCRPTDTGIHSSNCKINDLGIQEHLKRYGFHPYELELTAQVRNGLMAREEAVARIESSLDEARIDLIRAELL